MNLNDTAPESVRIGFETHFQQSLSLFCSVIVSQCELPEVERAEYSMYFSMLKKVKCYSISNKCDAVN